MERREHFVAYVRENEEERIWILVNGGETAEKMTLPVACTDLQSGKTYEGAVCVEAKSALIVKETGGRNV